MTAYYSVLYFIFLEAYLFNDPHNYTLNIT